MFKFIKNQFYYLYCTLMTYIIPAVIVTIFAMGTLLNYEFCVNLIYIITILSIIGTLSVFTLRKQLIENTIKNITLAKEMPLIYKFLIIHSGHIWHIIVICLTAYTYHYIISVIFVLSLAIHAGIIAESDKIYKKRLKYSKFISKLTKLMEKHNKEDDWSEEDNSHYWHT